MREALREGRREWAAAHGWSYAPTASIRPDILSGVLARVDVTVEDEITGPFGGRNAYVHDRAPFVGGVHPSQFFRSVSAVDAGVAVPRAYVMMGSGRWFDAIYDLKRRAYFTPHVQGMTHLERAGGTHIWCEPAGVAALQSVLGPLLEAGAPAAPAGARRTRMLIASAGQTVYVCDQLSINVESDIQRLELAHGLGVRYAQLMQGTLR